jgi:hypothetical protein
VEALDTTGFEYGQRHCQDPDRDGQYRIPLAVICMLAAEVVRMAVKGGSVGDTRYAQLSRLCNVTLYQIYEDQTPNITAYCIVDALYSV